MDRSRSKRGYHYDASPRSPPRSKPRHFYPDERRRHNHHPYPRRRSPPPAPPPPPLPPPPTFADSPNAQAPHITTSFRILLPEVLAPLVLGDAGEPLTEVRRETGAWVTVHPLAPGDAVRIIEAADSSRREMDGRPPLFSSAQDALILIHRLIVDAESEFGECVWDSGRDRDRDRGKVTSRLVVSRMHVGCLLGKGGKIIEQMRAETRTHIRVLPREQNTPRCVSMSDEIVQIVGEPVCVKRAMAVISDRLKESMHRDRGPFRGRPYSPERHFPLEDEYSVGTQHFSVLEDSSGRLDRSSNSHVPVPPGYDLNPNRGAENNISELYPHQEIVFRILCPNSRMETFIGNPEGLMSILQDDVGVDVRICDPVANSDERIVIIISREAPDDELFPAQEALLQIQTRIVDLGPDMDNIITTRLLVPENEVQCLEARDWSLSDIQRLTSANVQIMPKEDLPSCASQSDELIQIVGEIKAARYALVQITERLRGYMHRDASFPNDVLPRSFSSSNQVGYSVGPDPNNPINPPLALPIEGYRGIELSNIAQRNHTVVPWPLKDARGLAGGSLEQEVGTVSDEMRQSSTKRFATISIVNSTLKVGVPKSAISSLTMRSGNKLAQISEMSGATVTLLDDRPDQVGSFVQISGTPEQTDKANSLLQGFILSIQDVIPPS